MKPWRTGPLERLAFGLSLGVAVAVFETWPALDLWASRGFYSGDGFPGAQWGWVWLLYEWSPVAARGLVVLALALLLWAAVRPRSLAPHRVRQAGALVLLAAFGVGLVVHNLLKDTWGRPRPVLTQEFGGPHPFQPALQPTDLCPRNCSFVSGHAAGGFMLMALGLFGSRRTRWRWWAAGLVAGGTIGVARMAAGGHYLSDIVFSFLALWLVALLIRELWLRLAVRRRRRRALAA